MYYFNTKFKIFLSKYLPSLASRSKKSKSYRYLGKIRTQAHDLSIYRQSPVKTPDLKT